MPSRRSIRLPEYDYSQEGGYYITLCIHNKQCLLSDIDNGEVSLRPAGEMIEHWLHRIPHKYPHVTIGEYVIMPNHIHFILTVGADPVWSPR